MSPHAYAQVENETLSYRFKQDDTLLALAGKYLINRDSYVRVMRLNNIKDERAIPVGFELKIPYDLLKSRPGKAIVAAFRGEATGALGKSPAAAAKIGASYGEGALLATGKSASLSLQLDDGSKITMPSNSRMRISRLRTILLTSSIDYEFSIEKGGATSKVTPFRKREDRYRLRTPITVSAVRGTEFRSRYEETDKSAFAELLEGGLAVETSGKAASLAPGFGAIASPKGMLTEALLPPPQLLAGSGTQREASLLFSVAPQARADAFRLQIARDSGFIDIAEDVSGNSQLALPALGNGNYFARISAIADNGLEGLPVTFGFKRRLNTVAASATAGNDGYIFRWDSGGEGVRRFQFQLFRTEGGLATPIDAIKLGVPIIDEPGLKVDSLVLSDLPPGQYFWRVGTLLFAEGEVDQTWTEFESFTVSPE